MVIWDPLFRGVFCVLISEVQSIIMIVYREKLPCSCHQGSLQTLYLMKF